LVPCSVILLDFPQDVSHDKQKFLSYFDAICVMV